MKAIFFDFDGTLTYTSLNFWKKLWATLGYDIKEGSYYKNLFYDAIAGKFSHQEWCDKCCAKFMEAGLTKEILLDIANTIDMMDGFEETMKKLKEMGYMLFIVSGNIREVIDHNIGEATKYFEGIYANKFIFNAAGRLTEIIGTKYDNAGKADIIKYIARVTETDVKDIWFVGNGDNDEWVYTTGCKTLLINPYGTKKHDDNTVWHKQIKNVTNLTQILDVIKD